MPTQTEKTEPKPPRKRSRKVVRKDLIKDRGWQVWLFATGAVALIALTVQISDSLRVTRQLKAAEDQISKGFAALAAETLEPVRTALARDPRGCKALLGAYFGARRPDRLEWAAQACLSAGVESADIHLAIGAAREQMGQDADAIRIYNQTAQKFSRSPDPHYRIAQFYRRLKRDNEAAEALLKAAEMAPTDAQLSMETLEALSSVQRWTEARRMGDRIKGVVTEDPEVKLVIARALLRGGDEEGARTLVVQARELLGRKPELAVTRNALERQYADVLTPPPPARKPASPGQKLTHPRT